jgi:hypothetical protein
MHRDLRDKLQQLLDEVSAVPALRDRDNPAKRSYEQALAMLHAAAELLDDAERYAHRASSKARLPQHAA